MRLVLFGDGESPHLLKWARALAPRVELWAVSSRGFLPGFDAVLPSERRLALATRPDAAGGNFGLLRKLPELARALRRIRPDWVHAHYLTSHGTLAWLATRGLGAPGRLVGSAWGSDILLSPRRSRLIHALTRRVLAACALSTSDSLHMAEAMRAMGAAEVMTFPFGLEALPPPPPAKDAGRFFANRGLEPIYAPERVLDTFTRLAWPGKQLHVANDGSLRASLQAQGRAGVHWLGRLDAERQATEYAQARWYLSLPTSDSVAVSVLEAMAHGCIPILSDLPANRELVRDGENGLILRDGEPLDPARLAALLPRADAIAQANRSWVAQHALFAPCVEGFVRRLHELV